VTLNQNQSQSETIFVLRWKVALRYADLPVNVKGFAVLLSTWADADGTNCFPSIARQLVPMGYSKRTIQDYLNRLEATGWLKIEHGGGRLPDGRYAHNVYTLKIPAGAETASMQPDVRERVLSTSLTVQPEHNDLSKDIAKDHYGADSVDASEKLRNRLRCIDALHEEQLEASRRGQGPSEERLRELWEEERQQAITSEKRSRAGRLGGLRKAELRRQREAAG
jgi:hypothetical protein